VEWCLSREFGEALLFRDVARKSLGAGQEECNEEGRKESECGPG